VPDTFELAPAVPDARREAGGGVLRGRDLQLRRLDRGHGQPAARGPRGFLRLHRQLPVRPDNPEAHRPVLRRPPHHRLLRLVSYTPISGVNDELELQLVTQAMT